jgi:hypothetical protein
VNERPVFVLGNQKAGTTAVAGLLARHAGLTFAHDLTRGLSGLAVAITRGQAPLQDLVDARRAAFGRDILKDPNLTFAYDALRERFPEAPVVMVVRDPRRNIRSILDRLGIAGTREAFRPARHPGTFDEYPSMADDWGIILDGTWMGLGGDNYVGRLAARWDRAARVYLEHDDVMTLVRYEDFLEDRAAAVEALARRLGLPAYRDVSPHVDVQYQPPGPNRGVDPADFFSPDNLARIESRCEPAMRRLGYTEFVTR